MTAVMKRMKMISWRTFAEVVGISAVVGSLLFVGVQIQLDRKVASSQVNMAALEGRVAVEAAIAEHANIWTKAAKLENLTDSETQVMENLIKMAESKSFFESMAGGEVRGRSGTERFEDTSAIISGFSILLFDNPGARRIWLAKSARQDAYHEAISTNMAIRQFNSAVRRQLEKLDEGQKAGAF